MATARKTALIALIVAAAAAFWATSAAASAPVAGEGDLQRVMFVGNNWEGTADVIAPDPDRPGKFKSIALINIVPDLEERRREILTDPERLAFFLGIRAVVGEGNNQFVDDMYSSNDGTKLIVSRPSLRDVVAIDLTSSNLQNPEIDWRFEVDGQRSDHMGLSPDGQHVAVSASTGNVVHVLDVDTGEEVWRFPSGDSPHENVYSTNGKRIYHASIGAVYTPADQPEFDSTKGERYFQVVDTRSHEILKRIDMGQKLEEAGYPRMSSAVRPMALAPGEKWVYFQVSFFHGFVEYDLKRDRVTRLAHLPIADHAKDTPRELYVLDSAHHGLAMNPDGTKLCAAGTMSDYAAIVSRKTFEVESLIQQPEDARPYWSTNWHDGSLCFVSWSGLDQVSAISYETGEVVDNVNVGTPESQRDNLDPDRGRPHPQRMRVGFVPTGWPN